jgi:hypothetical protein
MKFGGNSNKLNASVKGMKGGLGGDKRIFNTLGD